MTISKFKSRMSFRGSLKNGYNKIIKMQARAITSSMQVSLRCLTSCLPHLISGFTLRLSMIVELEASSNLRHHLMMTEEVTCIKPDYPLWKIGGGAVLKVKCHQYKAMGC